MRPRPCLVTLLVPFALAAQAGPVASASGGGHGGHGASASTTERTATAVRVTTAPDIDGRDNEDIWKEAPSIDVFHQVTPTEGGQPTFRTVAKVAYDDKFLYVFVRMYDPHPDSIVGMLSRRDVKTQSDWVHLIIDSYHDRRSGYEFAVNPRGVKRDYYIYNDEKEDESWDGIWDVETRIDSLGWTAEFRIPFDQMRFAAGDTLAMGFGVWRDIARLNESDSWPQYRHSLMAISSQMGEITGLTGVSNPRHLELMPYVVAKNETWPSNWEESQYERQQTVTGGLDLKYGVTSNVTLDATVNPDFGQVESDPAVLNLSNFETYRVERRPFFVEGMGLFHFDMWCGMNQCSGLFYSRRIGRQPELTNFQSGSPNVTSIIGAAKLTGRTAGGFSFGVLDAYTAKEMNAPDSIGNFVTEAEPPTNYFAGQLVQEFRDGQTSFAIMGTAVNRQNSAYTGDSLRDAGYTGGVRFENQFGDRTYAIRAWVAGSRVEGTDSAIAITQQNSAHYYQRPGSGLIYDPSRTSLTGDAEKLAIEKIGGGVFRFWVGLSRISPGFEINDLGYLQQSGVRIWDNWIGLEYNTPTKLYRSLFVDFSEKNQWTDQGLAAQYLAATNASVSAHMQLHNNWTFYGGFDGNQFFGVYDPTKARGGPAMFRHPFHDGFVGFSGDPRLSAVPSLDFSAFDGSGGLSHGWGVGPSVLFHFSASTQLQIGVRYDLNWNYQEWVGNGYTKVGGCACLADTVYTFATLHQNTLSSTVRFDATFTPRLSFQFYAQPYISTGTYENWRMLDNPRAKSYSDEFKPFSEGYLYPNDLDSAITQYNFKYLQLNVNTVLRWEYRRGSALYLVWTHGRAFSNSDQAYQGFSPGADANELFTVHPMNTFLIKASYWYGT